jgi:hypothetical protein
MSIRERLSDSRFVPSDDRAQGSNLTGLIIGVAVAAIVGVGVGIPIINDVISSAGLTGITATVVGFIPIMLGLLIFVAAASPIMNRT